MNFKIKDTFYVLKQHWNKIEPYKIYIRAIIDSNYIVYKWYAKTTKSWRYVIIHKDLLEIEINQYRKSIELRKKKQSERIGK